MEKLTGACIIGQSGGPTAVINASAQGVIQTGTDGAVCAGVDDGSGAAGLANDHCTF